MSLRSSFGKIEPDDKLSVLVHVAPKEIQQMIFLHSNTLDTYNKTKEYIEQYLTSRKPLEETPRLEFRCAKEVSV